MSKQTWRARRSIWNILKHNGGRQTLDETTRKKLSETENEEFISVGARFREKPTLYRPTQSYFTESTKNQISAKIESSKEFHPFSRKAGIIQIYGIPLDHNSKHKVLDEIYVLAENSKEIADFGKKKVPEYINKIQ